MKLRKILFFASILFLVSCEGSDDDKIAKLESQMDSLTSAHKLSVDSLNRIIADYQKQLSQLKIREAEVRDSVAGISEVQKKLLTGLQFQIIVFQ